MPVTQQDLQHFVDANPVVSVAYITHLGTLPGITVLIYHTDRVAGRGIPRNFHELDVHVRYVDQLAAKTPRDPEETVDLDEPDHDA